MKGLFMKTLVTVLICLIGLALVVPETSFAEVYCVDKYMSKYRDAQNRINYLVRERNRTNNREDYNSFQYQINDVKETRDSHWSDYERCEERVRELCGHPKWKPYGTVRRCVNFYRAAGSI